MKTSLLYSFAILLLLLFVSLDNKKEEQISHDIETCQTIDFSIDCTMPEVRFTKNIDFKNLVFKLLTFTIPKKESAYKVNLSVPLFKLQTFISINIKTHKQAIFRTYSSFDPAEDEINYLV